MSETTKCVRVTGRVQGVGFRAWTQSQAMRLGLRGWVRNEPDGSVAALVSGDEASVSRMLEALRAGPPGAAVDGLVSEDAGRPDEGGFEVRT